MEIIEFFEKTKENRLTLKIYICNVETPQKKKTKPHLRKKKEVKNFSQLNKTKTRKKKRVESGDLCFFRQELNCQQKKGETKLLFPRKKTVPKTFTKKKTSGLLEPILF